MCFPCIIDGVGGSGDFAVFRGRRWAGEADERTIEGTTNGRTDKLRALAELLTTQGGNGK